MFSLNETQDEKLSIWMMEQDKKVAEKQGKDRPYYGCSGGAYSYTFTPTSLGLGVSVTNNLTKETINLTDHGDW